jgi:RHS repeat-associated protein
MTNVTNFDPQGNVLAAFDYGYDHDWVAGTDTVLGQRTSVNVAAVAGTYLETGLTKYGYDTRYQLARQDHTNGSYETWSYDAIGNRTSWRTMFGTTIGSTFFKNGTNPNNGQRLRNDGTGSDYTYDANGNVTRSSPGDTFAWDYANRLTSYASAYSSAAYSYDYLGLRRSTTVNGLTTRYITEGMQTVGERNTSTGVSTDYLFGPGIDEPLAKHMADGSIWYYGADGLGSMVLMTYSSGILANSNRYTAWGQPAVTNELFGYTGRENGGPSWFNRARYYDATTGRFLSEDPLGLQARMQIWDHTQTGQTGQPLGANLLTEPIYSYAGNNPISRRDPFGTCSSCSSCAPTPGGPYPWQTPYGPGVAAAYGNAIGGPFSNDLNDVSRKFPNDPWSNCVRGCLLCDWDPCKKEYRSGFYGAHAKCYATCGLVWAAYNGPPPLLNTIGGR